MVFVIILIIIIVAVVQYRSTLDPLGGITLDYHPSKLLIEPGEEFEIITTVTNTRRRFVPYIKLDQAFPTDLSIDGLEPAITNESRLYSRYMVTLYLMPRAKHIRKVKATLPKRGRYIFQGAYMRGGDFLGFSDQLKKYNILREVVVYPNEIESGNIDIVMGGIMGDISVRRLVIEDPILTAQFRDYSGREPMKAISWNHSARAGKLMVKQFDHTIDPAISVMLDVDCSENDKKELAFSLTRNVCKHLEDKGMKYDFLTNATTSNQVSRWSYLPESIGARHFRAIMEGLGRATYASVESLEELTRTFVGKRLYDRFVILITVKDRASVAPYISRIEAQNGGKVFVISTVNAKGVNSTDEPGIFSETAV